MTIELSSDDIMGNCRAHPNKFSNQAVSNEEMYCDTEF